MGSKAAFVTTMLVLAGCARGPHSGPVPAAETAAAPSAVSAQASKEHVDLVATLYPVQTGESPILLTVLLINWRDEAVRYTHFWPEDTFRVIVREMDGTAVRYTEEGSEKLTGMTISRIMERLPPQRSTGTRYDLSRYFELEAGREYEVVVSATVHPLDEPHAGRSIQAATGPIRLRVPAAWKRPRQKAALP